MAADITTVQALADEIARAAFDEGIAHGKGAKNFCGSNGKVPALIDALIAQMQRDAVQPIGWVDDGGMVFWRNFGAPPADGTNLYAAPHPEAQALDSARPVTAQEDRVLRNAALRSSTLVAKGKLVDSQLQQPDADSTRASGVRATTTPLPDPQLCKFYAVETWPELVAAMERHINKLQAKLPATPSLAPQRVREG